MTTFRLTKLFFLIGAILAISCTVASGSHVVGGNLEMTRIDKTPGRFKIALNMYFDEINQDVGGVPQGDALILVYRKADNKTMAAFDIPYFSRQSINYTNQSCATLRQIKTSLYRYEGIVNWNPADFSDPGGYYMTWQYCCRNGDIDNIRSPLYAGQTFYLEFPALTQNGQPFTNSSPVFDQVDGEYLCVNDPFRFSFDAKDADGDELKYYLATPFDRLDVTQGLGSQNGKTIQWLPGFSATNAIPGSPPLSVNEQTGELSVTPGQLGLFVFTVVVEEYRNGKKIGIVRRDYQLFVVDCPPTSPPDPTITVNNQPVSQIQLCEGKTVELKATANTNWEYQWKKDGNNITGATSSALTATETGVYLLVTSLKAQCSKSRRSADIKVTVTKSRFKIKSRDPLRLCGSSGSVQLEAFSGTGLLYQWYYNGKLISDMNPYAAKQPGEYWAIVRDNVQGCTSYSDTLQVISASLPTAFITPQYSTTLICTNDSLRLTAPFLSGYQYLWSLNNKSITGSTGSTIVVRQTGQYKVTVTDSTGCQQISEPFNLSSVSAISISMDSIPKQCGFTGNLITLKGSPSGGLFEGPGVSGNKFDPQKAGVGHHTIIYRIKSDLVCQQGVSERIAVVAAPSVIITPARSVTEICEGDSIVLKAQTPLEANQYIYNWGKNDQLLSDKESITAKQAGKYQVSITDKDGCQAQSAPYFLTITPSIHVRMDSVPTFCGLDHPPVTLRGYPGGGVFDGPGVSGNQYDPHIAGIGEHILTYRVNSEFSCQNGTAQRSGNILAPPAVDLGPDLEIWKGSSVQLHSATGHLYQYQWFPQTSLTDPTIPSPVATPDHTTSYTLVVTDGFRCSTSGIITINVYDRIWIPDAFSPNGDGQNEYWELRGIESYPLAEVTIYNRWGEIVFFSKSYNQPFDGKFENTPLPPGVYTYQIKPSPSQSVLRGSLTIIK